MAADRVRAGRAGEPRRRTRPGRLGSDALGRSTGPRRGRRPHRPRVQPRARRAARERRGRAAPPGRLRPRGDVGPRIAAGVGRVTELVRHGALLMTYGSPETLERDDIASYLSRVRGGREADPALVDEFTRRYRLIGGSPLVGITRRQA